MKDISKQPEYPCFDITNESKDVELFSALQRNLLYSIAPEVEKYWLNHLLVDCKGDVYKVVGVESLGWWRRFVPFAAKSKLLTEYTGDRVGLDELRAHMIKRYDSLDWENSEYQEIYESFREKIIKAKDFKELMYYES